MLGIWIKTSPWPFFPGEPIQIQLAICTCLWKRQDDFHRNFVGGDKIKKKPIGWGFCDIQSNLGQSWWQLELRPWSDSNYNYKNWI